MIYRKLETCGECSVEHTVEGEYTEVLGLFLELEKGNREEVTNNINITTDAFKPDYEGIAKIFGNRLYSETKRHMNDEFDNIEKYT